MLTVASANVTKQETRGYAKISGCMLLSRVHALESQFNEAGALKIGVQEGRAKEEQLRAGVYNQMVVAAASGNGNYGVQAWFRKSLGFEFLAVNVVNPRLMAVAAKHSCPCSFDKLSFRLRPPWELLKASAAIHGRLR